MSIQITITDPTRDEALRMADYLFSLAGYGKKDGIVSHERVGEAVSHRFETTPAQVADQLKSQIEAIAASAEFIDSAGATCKVSELANAVVNPVSPPPPSASVETVLVDSAGHTWDERIHASSKAVVSDGTWRLRRNLDPAVLNAVLAERGVAPAPATPATPGAWPFPTDGVPPPPPPSDATTLSTEPSVGVPPPPPAVTPAAPAATGTLTFAAFMQRVTAAIGAGTIAQTDVAAALAAESVASIPLLASVHTDKIDAVAARLGV